MRTAIRWAVVSSAVLFSLVAAASWMLLQASRHEPSFYRQALSIEPERLAVQGESFEYEVLELRNESRASGEWEAAFTAEQLNGWLAVDLPQKFPSLLPAGLQEPRVAIEAGEVRVAARYQNRAVSSIVSFALELQLTDEPNTIAICVRKVRAGALPIPIQSWLEKVQQAVRKSDLVVRWSQSQDDPVLLVQIPVFSEQLPHRQLTVDSLAVHDGEVRVSGSTMDREAPLLAPSDRSSPEAAAIVQRPEPDASSKNDTTHR